MICISIEYLDEEEKKEEFMKKTNEDFNEEYEKNIKEYEKPEKFDCLQYRINFVTEKYLEKTFHKNNTLEKKELDIKGIYKKKI
jgi:hypothetical protein